MPQSLKISFALTTRIQYTHFVSVYFHADNFSEIMIILKHSSFTSRSLKINIGFIDELFQILTKSSRDCPQTLMFLLGQLWWYLARLPRVILPPQYPGWRMADCTSWRMEIAGNIFRRWRGWTNCLIEWRKLWMGKVFMKHLICYIA